METRKLIFFFFAIQDEGSYWLRPEWYSADNQKWSNSVNWFFSPPLWLHCAACDLSSLTRDQT